MVRGWFRFLFQACLLLVLMCALYVSFWRESLAILPDIEHLLERQASEVLGTSVSVHGVRGQLIRFNPHLQIASLEVQHPFSSFNVISLKNLRFKINLWESIKQRLLVFDGVHIESGKLVLPQKGVLEKKSLFTPVDWRAWANVLLQQKNLFVERLDIHHGQMRGVLLQGLIQDGDRDAKVTGFEGQLQLEYEDQWIYGFLQGRGSKEMWASGVGQLLFRGGGTGTPALDQDPMTQTLAGLGFFDGSVTVVDGVVDGFQGYGVFSPSLVFSPIQDQSSPLQKSMSLAVAGRVLANGVDHEAKVVGRIETGHLREPFYVQLGQTITGKASLRMKQLLSWGRIWLPTLQMQGQGEIDIAYDSQWHVNFRDLEFEHQNPQGQTVIALGPLNGVAVADRAKGRLDLADGSIDLALPLLFRQPLANVQLHENQIHWTSDAHGFQVQSDNFRLTHEDASGSVNWKVQKKASDVPTVAVLAQLESSTPNQYQQYLPRKLPIAFLNWMDQAIDQGQLNSGRILYHGPLKPSPKGLQFQLEGEDLGFKFHPSWPKVRDAAAQVYVGPGVVDFEVQVPSSDSLSVTGAGKVRSGRLLLDLQAQGQAAAGFRYLMQSPLQQNLQRLQESLTLTKGDFVSDIALDLSLSELGRHHDKMTVATDLDEIQLQIPAARLEVDRLTGPLVFDSNAGLTSKGLSAQVFGRPTKVDLRTKAFDGGPESLLTFEGVVGAEAISSWLDLPIIERVVGETQVNGALTIPWQGQATTLALRSDLVGLNIGLPKPFGKSAAARRDWQLDLTLADDSVYRVYDENRYKAQFQIQEGQVFGLDLMVGDTSASLPDAVKAGQRWSFDLAWLDIAAWLELSKGMTTTESSGSAWSWLPEKAQIDIRELRYEAQDFGKILLSMNSEPSGWRLQFDGDLAQGFAFLPKSEKTPVRLNVRRLVLPTGVLQGGKVRPKSSSTTTGVASWPPMEIMADGIYLKGQGQQPQYVGRLELSGEPATGSYTWQEMYAQVARTHWRGSGHISENLGSEYTVEFGGGSVDRFYELADLLFDQQERPLSASSFTGLANVRWPGIFPSGALLGEGQVQFEQGLIRGLDGVSPIRWLSLLSAERFARRLRFDFSDLAERGLAFDQLEIRFAIEQPRRIEQMLTLESPSIKLEAEGWVDLAQERIFQQCVAIIPLLDHLVLPAAAAGGLPAAATAFVLDKAFGNSIDELTKVRWQVKGPLKNPKAVQ